MTTSKIVIVGGGITGILCALRLSKESSQEHTSITLIDSNETLGGRFFFTHSSTQTKSGFGFERENFSDLEALKRHLFLYLTEDEGIYLDNYLQHKINQQSLHPLHPKKYFIKKNFLNSEYILLSNSEFLTKKEAEFLYQLMNFQKNENYEKDKDLIFETSALWKAVDKNSRDGILQILTCTLGKSVLQLSLKQICEEMQLVFKTKNIYYDPFFLRFVEIERAFEEILKRRNVTIYNKCTASSLDTKDHEYILTLHHEFTHQPDDRIQERPKVLHCDKIIFTIAPYHIRNLLQKEHFPSELARFVSKIQPTSLVCLEINDFENKLQESMQNTFYPLDTLYFPIEGVAAFITSDQCLHFFLEIDYESSLQAPSVRDTIAQMRRAARRILKPEFSEELKKGSFLRKIESFERIILLSVANNLPKYTNIANLPILKSGEFQLQNIYAAGDYFYSLDEIPWKRITKSVEQVVCQISSN